MPEPEHDLGEQLEPVAFSFAIRTAQVMQFVLNQTRPDTSPLDETMLQRMSVPRSYPTGTLGFSDAETGWNGHSARSNV